MSRRFILRAFLKYIQCDNNHFESLVFFPRWSPSALRNPRHLNASPFAPPPSTLTFIGRKFGWLHGNRCLGSFQGACRVAPVVVVSTTELLQLWFPAVGPARLRPTDASANTLTRVKQASTNRTGCICCHQPLLPLLQASPTVAEGKRFTISHIDVAWLRAQCCLPHESGGERRVTGENEREKR